MPPSTRCPSPYQHLLRGVRSVSCAAFMLVVLGCLAYASGVAAAASSAAAQGDATCKCCEKFFQIGRDQLTKRAIHREEPDMTILNQAGVDATIVVRVFVDKNGNVVCDTVAGDPNPLLAHLVLKAASAWTFQPFVKNGKLEGMQGDIVFHLKR